MAITDLDFAQISMGMAEYNMAILKLLYDAKLADDASVAAALKWSREQLAPFFRPIEEGNPQALKALIAAMSQRPS